MQLNHNLIGLTMTLGILVALAYGILVIVGGIIGYFKANSIVSLISGSVSGLLLVFAAIVQFQGHNWGSILATIVTTILLIFFTLRLVKTRKFMPAGLMTILGIVALAVMVKQVVVFIT